MDSQGVEPNDQDLRGGYGLATATFVVISSMVGTGVLTTSGYTVLATGSNLIMLGLWVLGGIVALCGALALAELAAALPHTGGDYVFLREAYGPLVAFLSGWVSFLIGFGAPIAASGLAAAKYLNAALPPLGLTEGLAQKAIATSIILLLAVVHLVHNGLSSRVQGLTTVVKLLILFGLAGAGIVAGRHNTANLLDAPARFSGDRFRAAAFSLVYIAYAYTGWNGAAYLAGEIRDAQRRLPRAIILGTGLVVALYLALNISYALALPAGAIQELAASKGAEAVAPIAEVAARQLYGPRISRILSVAIGLTMMASLSAFILTGPRVAYAMARAGHFPSFAGRVSRRGTPVVATLLQVGWALALLWTGTFESIVVYAGLGLSIFGMLTISAVYVLRWRRPELLRPFRTPGYPIVPAVFLIVTALLTAATISERRLESALALGSIAAGVPFYYAARRFRGMS